MLRKRRQYYDSMNFSASLCCLAWGNMRSSWGNIWHIKETVFSVSLSHISKTNPRTLSADDCPECLLSEPQLAPKMTEVRWWWSVSLRWGFWNIAVVWKHLSFSGYVEPSDVFLSLIYMNVDHPAKPSTVHNILNYVCKLHILAHLTVYLQVTVLNYCEMQGVRHNMATRGSELIHK